MPIHILDSNRLVDALALFGDAACRVVVWVMHSKPYYDLVKSQFAANIDGVSNFNIATGTPITLNRPVLVTDSAELVNGSIYSTLGLTAEAVVVDESETPIVHSEMITGLDNLVVRMQGLCVGCRERRSHSRQYDARNRHELGQRHVLGERRSGRCHSVAVILK